MTSRMLVSNKIIETKYQCGDNAQLSLSVRSLLKSFKRRARIGFSVIKQIDDNVIKPADNSNCVASLAMVGFVYLSFSIRPSGSDNK